MVQERTLVQRCPVVRVNVKFREMNGAVSAHGEREVEVLASGLPFQRGAQLAVDVTLRRCSEGIWASQAQRSSG